ncbi:MAG: hypothetical protein HYT31_00820 [Parcubacteria group bacterium]|nr:hypothetical protein [Parcubacteria group bacterium]
MDKKIFIIGFSTPILKDVALHLRDVGARIIYWQGYRDYFKTIAADKEHFSGTIFHYANDAIRNIPPQEIDVSNFEPPSKELIEKLYPYEGTALLLISRIDYSAWPLPKKLDLYYRYIQFWQGMIKRFKPDAILFPDVPHNGNNYVLYALAKRRNIKVIISEQIAVESRTTLVDDYTTSSLAIRNYYDAHKDTAYKVEDLSPDLRSYYGKHSNSVADATPEYQKRALARPAPFRTPGVRTILKHLLRLSILRVGFSYLRMIFMKNEEQTLDAPMRGFRYKLRINQWVKQNRLLEKEYARLHVIPDFSKKFVYMPLNVQPERTTCPQAGVYDDQLLMVETVARSLPAGWKLYVKENPNQLRPSNAFSRLYRHPGYYERIAALPNVKLVPLDTSTYDLMQHSQVVGVATGTAGWEGLLRGKPALVFGSVWYMYCDGVFRIADLDSCRTALSNIAAGYTPDKQKVLNYLIALDCNSIRARHFRTLRYDEKEYKKEDFISHDDNLTNLSKALSSALGL